MLATELPTLPADLAEDVRAHFRDLTNWLEAVLGKGAQLGLFELQASPRLEAEAFMSTVYGAMLTARANGEPKLFADIVEHGLNRLLRRPAAEETKKPAKGSRPRR
jgi:TetR/AcrR family transcriptional repressor of nem operon